MKAFEVEIDGVKMYFVGDDFCMTDACMSNKPVPPEIITPPEPEEPETEEVPKLSAIRPLVDTTQFSWQKINQNTIFLNSNVNFAYASGSSYPTQIQNIVAVNDLNLYKGIVVDLVMTYTNILAYQLGDKHYLYGVAGNNYGIFRIDVGTRTLTADKTPQKQFYKANGDIIYARYVEPRQAGTSRLKIDVIRNNGIASNSSLVYTLPADSTPMLGISYGWSQGSNWETMINPANVVARNLTFVKAGSPLLKETLTTQEISELISNHKATIAKGIPE